MEPKLPTYLLTGHVAKLLGVSKFVIKRMCDLGELRCHRTNSGKSGHRRIHRDSLERWARENGVSLDGDGLAA